jgi:3'-phosphoadenosine 5'-phosphosulfate sulfotransferase (PAPS reductase)/FAD synthetase
MNHPDPQYRSDKRLPSGRNHPQPWEHVVSVSGGKDSTVLYLLAVERGMPFTAVFADTGHEHPFTYEAIAELPRLTGGPEIITVRRDFTEQLAGKREHILTKWPDLGIPDEHIRTAAELMHPTGNPFLDLCMWKGLFPSARARFCTDELKLVPMYKFVQEPILADGRTLVSWQGVRAEESIARRDLERWQRINPVPYCLPAAEKARGEEFRAYAYRPIHTWKLADIWAMHLRHGVPRNPLYAKGATRVGCFPCIHSRKSELRMIGDNFPGFIDRLETWERVVTAVSKRGAQDGFAATFFPASDDPLWNSGDEITLEGNGIRQRVEWSRTSRGGKQFGLFLTEDFGTACSNWGVCE